jgi:outer membrane biogenesis lipoprotein LolB
MRTNILALLLLAGCTAPADDPPQTHVGTCTHYQDATRRLEDVPNCELRTRHVLINGLQPASPGNKS